MIVPAGNDDSAYVAVNTVHATAIQGVSFVRQVGTDVANVFGRKGFEKTRYDKARLEALLKLQKDLQPNEKICDLRMDIETRQANISVHAYGTRYALRSQTKRRSSGARRKSA